MGCVASKLDINDVHPNIFAVNNVDDVSILSSYENMIKLSWEMNRTTVALSKVI